MPPRKLRTGLGREASESLGDVFRVATRVVVVITQRVGDRVVERAGLFWRAASSGVDPAVRDRVARARRVMADDSFTDRVRAQRSPDDIVDAYFEAHSQG
jgi:hypothetical protein